MSRRRLRRRRTYGLVMVLAGGVIVLAGVYLVVTGLLARNQLNSVRAEVQHLRAQISAGDLDGARATARSIAGHAGSAHSYTGGPVWAVAGKVPAGGAPIETVRTITAEVDDLGQNVLPEVVTATRQLDPSTLRSSDGTIDLARIQAVAPSLDTADLVMSRATSSLAARPASSWLGPVDTARSTLLTQLRSLGKTLHSADLAARIAPQMLGVDGPKRYFIGFQNDAEARATGGLPGAFGIVRADHGKISIERFEPDNTLNGVSSSVDFGYGYNDIWGFAAPKSVYVDSNVSAHFPYAAQIWLSMWQKKSGERLDGALAVDPTALSYLLAVTGPATLPDKSLVSSGNIVSLTQQELYARYPSDQAAPARKNYLLAVAKAVAETVLSHPGSTTALVKAAGRAGAQRRLLVYSTDASVETDLQGTSLAGSIPQDGQPYAGVAVNNTGGNKLDYYLDREIDYRRTGCGSTRSVTVTIRLTNAAPTGLPAYVIERNDVGGPPADARPGDNRLNVAYYATTGASLRTATLDGRVAPLAGGYERGHPVFTFNVEVPRGRTQTLVLHLTEPAGTAAPTLLRQPLVRPLKVSVHDQRCG